MKKIIVIVSSLCLVAGVACAQDMEKATKLAQDANEALVSGNFDAAITGFTDAIASAGDLAEAGELVENCKKGLVGANWAKVNQMVKDGQHAEALGMLPEVEALATQYGDDETVAKAVSMKFQLHKAIANASIKAASTETDSAAKKAKFQDALSHLEIVMANEPEDGDLFIQKGQILAALGKKAEAVEAYEKAKSLGLEDKANKKLSTIYVKEASAKLRAKDYAGAIAYATKSNEYQENANAFKIAGQASQNLKKMEDALNYYEKYLQFMPNDAAVKQVVDGIKASLKK